MGARHYLVTSQNQLLYVFVFVDTCNFPTFSIRSNHALVMEGFFTLDHRLDFCGGVDDTTKNRTLVLVLILGV